MLCNSEAALVLTTAGRLWTVLSAVSGEPNWSNYCRYPRLLDSVCYFGWRICNSTPKNGHIQYHLSVYNAENFQCQEKQSINRVHHKVVLTCADNRTRMNKIQFNNEACQDGILDVEDGVILLKSKVIL